VKGDKIYNGALDNASGSAILLETARAFARMNPAETLYHIPRSDGRREGLTGSDFFAHYPIVEKKAVVANVIWTRT